MPSTSRTALDAAANVIKTETTVGANTATRVGTMVENLADSALLLAERQVGVNAVVGGIQTVFVTSGNTKITVASQAQQIVNCDVLDNSSIQAGAACVATIEASVTLTAAVGRRFIIYIGIDNVVQPISAADVTCQGSHPHDFRMQFCGSIPELAEIALFITTPTGNFSPTINTLNLIYHTV